MAPDSEMNAKADFHNHIIDKGDDGIVFIDVAAVRCIAPWTTQPDVELWYPSSDSEGEGAKGED